MSARHGGLQLYARRYRCSCGPRTVPHIWEFGVPQRASAVETSCGFPSDDGMISDRAPRAGRAGARRIGARQVTSTMANLENSGSTPLARASARGTVKWFNSTKGYGFITLDNGGDAFCHASALAAIGTPSLPSGATVVCDLQESPRGLQVTAVHSVDTSTAESSPPRRPRGGFGGGDRFGGADRFGGGDRFGGEDRFGGGDRFGGDRYGSSDRFSGRQSNYESAPAGPMVEGKVKFFNEQKGFGFVMPDTGGGDVYIHASALRRSGVSALTPEQRIRYSTRQGMKGVEVD